ncbi:flagellar basal body-associated FliL family protein [Falsirhodobacter halotolerans]|uniref:flagellar basal body-associated FliL family protein n=1 Tax=Falsirhodobacter halotolerans TaxID=1146892 RepID=UPI001FD5FEDD|nr:flagellar basal body-associated FliL family protein [Falsirhodobacter halotolerans]MCJ8140547.1 flagellar basal body-associated FliL family protein [Falsirhodobacter halotolerans]
MADMAVQPEARGKSSRLPLIIAGVVALGLGGAGFWATYTGMVALPSGHAAPQAPIAFVPLDALIISLGDMNDRQHLRFAAQLEVAPEHQAEVAKLAPRILDVLNGYLRAVSVSDLDNPAQLVRLRAQMLRRVQIVTGEGRVRDLLVTEFVMN